MGDNGKDTKTKGKLLARLHAQMQRPGQGPADAQHWIVMNLSRHKNLNFMPPSFPFRHPTEESAQKEAQRLAQEKKGLRYGVFEFTGFSAKVEVLPAVAPEVPATEPELQAA